MIVDCRLLIGERWIPAFAGMTETRAGMTETRAGMTETGAGMMWEGAGYDVGGCATSYPSGASAYWL